MIPTMTIDVEVQDRHGVVRTVNGLPATYKQVHYMKDEFKGILGDAQTRVSVGVDERFSGPAGTYSSVSVRVNITLACNQSKEQIDQASQMAFDYASDFIDRHAIPAAKLLNKHLAELAALDRDDGR